MRIIATDQISNELLENPDDIAAIYNGLDCCITYEVCQVLKEKLADAPDNYKETYATAMEKLPPVNFMCMQGLRVDMKERDKLIKFLSDLRLRLDKNFQKMCVALVGHTVNARSWKQVSDLFYQEIGVKPVLKKNTHGKYTPTTDDKALAKLQKHIYIKPLVSHILAIRKIGKKLGFIQTNLDADGRMRTSLNIAGTDTGRFSSQFSTFDSGSNLQNVENALRRYFVADPGCIFVNVDLEQADARALGAIIYNLFYDSYGPEEAGKFLDACESGDLHTQVCAMAWPELNWPEPFNLKEARKIADSKASIGMTYRDAAKRLGHGTNYMGKPPTMAMHSGAPVHAIADFQDRYFAAFPLIHEWHKWIEHELKTTHRLQNLFGRERVFFGRPNDQKVLNAAVAFAPQSTTGEFLDRGWLNLWHNMPEADLRLPVHDSILFQLPRRKLKKLLPEAMKLLEIEIELKGGRKFSIPLEAKVGFNWADCKKSTDIDPYGPQEANIDGLKAWNGTDINWLDRFV